MGEVLRRVLRWIRDRFRLVEEEVINIPLILNGLRSMKASAPEVRNILSWLNQLLQKML